VGTLIGVVLGASLGALAGAMAGEKWKGRDWRESWQVGQAAFLGRLLGTVGKIIFGSMIVAITLAALVLR
jgi:uncharacterized protein YqgC (DUF456 family)